MSGRSHTFVDIRDPAVGPNVERPPERERLVWVDDAIAFATVLVGSLRNG